MSDVGGQSVDPPVDHPVDGTVGWLLLAVLPLTVFPVVVGDSRTLMGVALGVVVAAGYAVGLNLLLGMTGQLFLCIGALGALGGYGTAVLADDLGLPVLVALATATAVCGVVGALLCWVAVRRALDTIGTGIVTLTVALAVHALVLGQRVLTGGEDGRRVAAGAETLLRDRVGGYYVMLAVVTAALLLVAWLDRSHHGWAFRALRDDPVAASLAGVDVAGHRVLAGAVGSTVVGLVGGLYGLVEGRLSPDVYSFTAVDVESLVVIALGGMGRVAAPLVGAVVLGLLDELLLRHLGTLRVAATGVVLVALFSTVRGGLLGAVSGGRRRRRG